MNNSPRNKIPRVAQMAYCCGAKFKRWRFVDKHFPGTHHTHCHHCGKTLSYSVVKPKDPKAAERARYHDRALKNRISGLTAHGTPAKRVVLTPEERLHRKLERQRKIYQARKAAGLTTRGTPHKRKSPQWVFYEQFRASMQREEAA